MEEDGAGGRSDFGREVDEQGVRFISRPKRCVLNNRLRNSFIYSFNKYSLSTY